MPGRVGELEAPRGSHERAVGDVDRDALLALGAEAVRQEREVDVAVAATLARLLHVLELVGHHLLRVVEEPPDERRLPVVDGAARDEAKELRRARSARMSLEVPDTLAVLHRRLAHLVVRTRLATLGDPRRGDLADDLVDRGSLRADAPVQLMSPTVRKRTVSRNVASCG